MITIEVVNLDGKKSKKESNTIKQSIDMVTFCWMENKSVDKLHLYPWNGNSNGLIVGMDVEILKQKGFKGGIMPFEMLDLAKQPTEQVLSALKPTKLTEDTRWISRNCAS